MAGENHHERISVDVKYGRKRKETVERLVAGKFPDGWTKKNRTKRASRKLNKNLLPAEGQSSTEYKEAAEVPKQESAELEPNDGTMALLLANDSFCEEHESITDTEVKEDNQTETPGDIFVEDYLKDECPDSLADPSEDELWVMGWKDMYELLSRGF